MIHVIIKTEYSSLQVFRNTLVCRQISGHEIWRPWSVRDDISYVFILENNVKCCLIFSPKSQFVWWVPLIHHLLDVLKCSIVVHGEEFVGTAGTYRKLMLSVASLDTMELYQHHDGQHLDMQQARYGWMSYSVEEMRHQFHSAVTEAGEFSTVEIIWMLVWCAASQKVNFHDNQFIS